MCDCVALVNAHLAPSNTVLDECSMVNFKTGKVRQSLQIKTCKLSRTNKRTRVRTMIPSFCPFCGVKIAASEAVESTEVSTEGPVIARHPNSLLKPSLSTQGGKESHP